MSQTATAKPKREVLTVADAVCQRCRFHYTAERICGHCTAIGKKTPGERIEPRWFVRLENFVCRRIYRQKT